MYLFINQDGDVTQSEFLNEPDGMSWPTVVKIEIEGMDIKVTQLSGDNEWNYVPVEG